MDPRLPAWTTDTDVWYDLWGSAVAIQGMCVRFGFEGSITSVGKYKLSILRALPCNHSLITNSGDDRRLIVWMLEQHNEHPYMQGNATLGTTIPNANLKLPSRIQSVGTS